MAQFSAALFVLWIFFYVVGQALLLIPSEFHRTVDEFGQEIGIEELDKPVPGGNGTEEGAQ